MRILLVISVSVILISCKKESAPPTTSFSYTIIDSTGVQYNFSDYSVPINQNRGYAYHGGSSLSMEGTFPAGYIGIAQTYNPQGKYFFNFQDYSELQPEKINQLMVFIPSLNNGNFPIQYFNVIYIISNNIVQLNTGTIMLYIKDNTGTISITGSPQNSSAIIKINASFNHFENYYQ